MGRKERFAFFCQLRVAVAGPCGENPPLVPAPEPIGDAVADDGPENGPEDQWPEAHGSGGRRGTDRKNNGGAGDNGAEQRHRLECGGEEY